MNLKTELKTLLRENLRDYGMFFALIVIILVFYYLTGGAFLSSRNVSNLMNQTGYIAVLAVGITLVIIIRHIDLSMGYVAGFLGAVSALLMADYDFPWFVAIVIVLLIGALIGFVNGFIVAKVEVPAFVVTLAGSLVFRGCLLLATEKNGTILVSNAAYNAIGNGYLPDLFGGSGIHLFTLFVGVVIAAAFLAAAIADRKNKQRYNFYVPSLPFFIAKQVLVIAAIGYLSYKLASYNGISYTVVIMGLVAALFTFITTKTKLGRHIYGIGGNPQAARLSGVNVEKVTVTVFMIMSTLAALAGVLYTARLRSASTTAGAGFEMDAIAAAYVGGVSAQGGVGRIPGTIIGALVMSSLINGMNLLNTGIHYQYIIRGLILVCAVLFDILSRRNSSTAK